MTGVSSVGSFLVPEGYAPPALRAVLRERGVVAARGRSVWHGVRGAGRRPAPAPWSPDGPPGPPVVLVPGFLAGDASLAGLARGLRRAGFSAYRAQVHLNIGCARTAADRLEARVEAIAQHRGCRVQLVGHSLGGMLARCVAARRPDLVAGVVTLGSPVLAPGAHHLLLAAGIGVLVRLSRAGLEGLMADDCVSGRCARLAFEETRSPLRADVALTAIYSRRDGIVDWRACLDPDGKVVEVAASHLAMTDDPRTLEQTVLALNPRESVRSPSSLGPSAPGPSPLGVDRGEIA